MPKRNDKLLLEDIIEAYEKINRFTEGMEFYEFAADEKTVDAVIRNLEIIGEASSRIFQ